MIDIPYRLFYLYRISLVLPILLVLQLLLLSPVRRRDEKGRFLRCPDGAIRKILFIYLFFVNLI